MNITRQNAAQACIAEAATRKSTCIADCRNIAQPLHQVQTLAAKSQVTVSLINNQLHFKYDPSRNPITDF
jgi:hypothetical protein